MNKLNARAGNYIKSNLDQLTGIIINNYSESNILKSNEKKLFFNGIKYNLSFLAEGIYFSNRMLYDNSIEWAKNFLSKNNVGRNEMIAIQETIIGVFKRELPSEFRKIVVNFTMDSIPAMKDSLKEEASNLNKNSRFYDKSKEYLKSLLNNKKALATNLIFDLVDKGESIKDIYLQIFEPAQKELGKLWQEGKITVAQEHYSTAVTQLIMSKLYNYLFKANEKGDAFIGACSRGELHEIGLRMVSDLLELEGWTTYYLGANMPARGIVKMITDTNAKIVGLSATMANNLSGVKEIIRQIKAYEGCKDVKIIVGGYAFKSSGNLWKNIGADYFAEGAIDAVKLLSKVK